MTNEEKAREIANKYCVSDYKDNSGQLVSSYNECYCSALAIAEWKDEQHAEAFAKLIIELDELKRQVKSLLP